MIYNEDIVDFLKDYQRRTREVLRRTEWLARRALRRRSMLVDMFRLVEYHANSSSLYTGITVPPRTNLQANLRRGSPVRE